MITYVIDITKNNAKLKLYFFITALFNIVLIFIYVQILLLSLLLSYITPIYI